MNGNGGEICVAVFMNEVNALKIMQMSKYEELYT